MIKRIKARFIGAGTGIAKELKKDEFVKGKYNGTQLDMNLEKETMLKYKHLFDKDKVLLKFKTGNQNGKSK